MITFSGKSSAVWLRRPQPPKWGDILIARWRKPRVHAVDLFSSAADVGRDQMARWRKPLVHAVDLFSQPPKWGEII
jgi:hypothetical protein